MPVNTLRRPLLAGLVLAIAGAVAAPAHAYTLKDWMRTWPTYQPGAQPVSPFTAWPAAPGAAGAAVTTPPSVVLPPSAAVTAPPVAAQPPVFVAPPPAAPPAAAPPPTFVQPPVATMPPAAGCGAGPVGCDTRGQTMVPMATTVPVAQAPPRSCCSSCFGFLCRMFHHPRRYQTGWARVPTTTFRPVVAFDPVTGTTRTTMQPCTTYSWQVQRVPFFGLGSPQAFFMDGSAATPGYMVAPAPELIDSGAYSPSAPSTPYYSPPSVPSAASPLAPPVPDATRGFPGSSGWGSSGGATGADQRPTLAPGEAQGLQNLQGVPSTSNYPPIPLSDPIETRRSGSDSGSDSNQSSSRDSTTLTVPVPVTSQPQRPTNTNPASKPPVQAVPDPDAKHDKDTVPAAPALFDPNDRTAIQLVSPAVVLAPIVWPDQSAEDEVRTARNDAPEPPRPESPRVDTGQWRVVRP